MRRSAAGFSLLELLAATALVGLMAVSLHAVVTQLWRETERAERETADFERSELAIARLRAELGRARKAAVSGRSLVVDGRRRFCVQNGTVVVLPAEGGDQACDAGRLAIVRRTSGTLVHVTLAEDRRVSVLVGGSP